jgi:hypothetical protein
MADHLATDAPGIDYLRRAREFAPDLTAAADEIERRRARPVRGGAGLVAGVFFSMLLRG